MFLENKNNKDKIIETAFSLSLKQGFDNVSIKQIQKEASVSAGSIYYHFEDKNDILASMIERFINKQIERYGENIRKYDGNFYEKLNFIFYHHVGGEINDENFAIELSDNNRIDPTEYDLFTLGVYHQHPEFRPLFEEFNRDLIKIYEEFIEEFKEKNEISNDIDTKDTAIYILTVLAGFAKLWVALPDFPFEKFVDINVKMICDTLGYQK